jgi:uncharacterized membrane protein AbrB (regulator of aidB expression)
MQTNEGAAMSSPTPIEIRMPFLLAVTAALVALLYLTGIPAAFLLGAMGAAMILACRGGAVRLPDWIFDLAQGVVGCLIARSFTPSLFHAVLQHLALFIGVTLSVLLFVAEMSLTQRGRMISEVDRARWIGPPRVPERPDRSRELTRRSDQRRG